MDCIFCSIAAGSAPARVVAAGDGWLAFLDIRPVTRGHTLVVPRRHVENVWGMAEEELRDVMSGAHRVAHLLRDRLEPDGMNLVQSNGTAAWQSVFHVHVHVVPRYSDDGLSAPWLPSAAEPSEIDEMHRRLTAAG